MDLNDLTVSCLSSVEFPHIFDVKLNSLEKWLHSGFKMANAQAIRSCLETVLPLALVRYLRRFEGEPHHEYSRTWASLLAAFMDSLTWTGLKLEEKEASWCELCLVGRPTYLVDVLLQMVTRTSNEQFVQAICHRIFSLNQECLKNAMDSLRILILYKWLEDEKFTIWKPHLKALANKHVNISILRKEITGLDDIDGPGAESPECFIENLFASYDLSRLVAFLSPELSETIDSPLRDAHLFTNKQTVRLQHIKRAKKHSKPTKRDSMLKNLKLAEVYGLLENDNVSIIDRTAQSDMHTSYENTKFFGSKPSDPENSGFSVPNAVNPVDVKRMDCLTPPGSVRTNFGSCVSLSRQHDADEASVLRSPIVVRPENQLWSDSQYVANLVTGLQPYEKRSKESPDCNNGTVITSLPSLMSGTPIIKRRLRSSRLGTVGSILASVQADDSPASALLPQLSQRTSPRRREPYLLRSRTPQQ